MAKVKLSSIRKNPYDTREDYGDLTGLMASIQKFGMLQPLPVRKTGGGYELVFGGRRYEAAIKSGLKEIDVAVKEVSNEDMASMALCENIHRKDLNPVELARAYNVALHVTGLELEEFAKSIGVSNTKVREYISILNLPNRILGKSEDYGVGELVGLARLYGYSRTLSIELENVLEDRSLPSAFLLEVVRACSRVYESNLPDKIKADLCGKVLWEDYSKLGSGQEGQIAEFSENLLQGELVKYNERLKKQQKQERP